VASTLAVLLLFSTQLYAHPAPGQVKSSALVELAETAHKNRSACGPLAVWYVLGRLGHRRDADELIASAGLNEQGTTIRRLLEMLSENNCSARAICTDKDRLTLLPVPSILIVDKGTHCVVYDGMDDERQLAKVFETTNKEIRFVDLKQLRRTWTGEAIIFQDPRPSPYAFCAMLVLAMSVIAAPAACLLFRRGRAKHPGRAGFTAIELLVAIGISGVLFAILLPAIQQVHESSRVLQCRANLHQVGIALHNYELHYRVFPPAVAWKPAGEPLGQSIAPPGSIDRISLGLASPLEPDRVYANWAIALLPFLGEDSLYHSFDLTVPVGDASNANGRATELPFMKCPTDAANTTDNHFQRSGLTATDQGYARGNYAINGGTSRRCLTRLSSRKVDCKDGVFVDGTDLRRDTSQVWGNGVAGVNRSMRRAEFTSGLSKLVLIEEIRAGVHSLDRRGVWTLGFAGSSVTACHGLYGNNGPNRGKDAIQGCSETATQVIDMEIQGMPCLQSQTDPRLEISERATARSMHVGGVNLLMADGSAHFVTDSIDRRTWHGLHKRDNQQPIDF
jgi:prepilin-type N-terminal cleavage/methylation domain-containing protein